MALACSSAGTGLPVLSPTPGSRIWARFPPLPTFAHNPPQLYPPVARNQDRLEGWRPQRQPLQTAQTDLVSQGTKEPLPWTVFLPTVIVPDQRWVQASKWRQVDPLSWKSDR